MSPEVDARLRVPPEIVKLPPRVIVPEPPAVKFIVPVAEELALKTIPPLLLVTNVRSPTVEAFKFTPLFSLTKATPDVFTARLPASVRI